MTFGNRHAVLAAVLAICTGAVARATVIVPADLTELVAESTAIVHGRVVEVRAEWTEGRRAIESYVTLAAATYLKGHLGERVTLRMPGGRLGAFRSIVVGAPEFREGDEVIVFLGNHGPSIPFLVGFSQGVYRVVVDAANGQRTVIPPAIMAAGGEPLRLVRGDGRRPAPTIEQFATDIRGLVAAAEAPRR
ncbi:MAG TPA: hypothetical protein VHJ77_07895 [Vicinamibacterales bacterium]|jgi:hypothetical protein|nr:hypothetical protein [Vicinamibacterales bacterium]